MAFDYYVDQVDGNDSNDGLTTGNAWKTMSKLGSTSIAAGKQVGLKRGCTWREQWSVNAGGNAGQPVIYGAYGSGAMPKITGCDLLTGWTSANIGAGLFSDGFESGDISRWSTSVNPGGQLAVTAPAALVGTRGLAVSIASSVHAYVQDNTPANEKTYRCRLYFDPNTLTMAGGNEFIFARALTSGSASVFFVKLVKASPYSLFIFGRNDAFVGTSWSVAITDAPHYIELEWVSATAAGANNGIWGASVDGVSAGRVTNLDSDTLSVDMMRIGAELELDAGTSGTMYFDGFYSNNTGTAIGATDPSVQPIYKATYAESIDTYLLLEDGNHLTGMGSLGAVTTAGQFFANNASNLIYAWATDSADPDTHVMEIGARYDTVVCDDRQHIEFQDLHFHGAGGQFGRGFGLKPTWNSPSDIVLRSCHISHSYYANVQLGYSAGFTAIDGFEMISCEVDHALVFGVICLAESTGFRYTNLLIQGCTIHDNGIASIGQGGIFIKYTTGALVTWNTIYNNSGFLDWSDNLLFGESLNAEVSYNTIYGGNHSGIHFDVNTNGFVCIYNVVYGCTWNGIWVEEHLIGNGQSYIYGNTTYNCLQGLVFGPGSTIREVSGVTVKNNLFAFSTRANIELNEDGVSPSYLNNTLDYNLYWVNTGSGLYEGEFRAKPARENETFAQWKVYTGWDAHSVDADPLLTDAAQNDYSITVASPANGVGVDLGTAYISTLNGNQSGAWDIGAYTIIYPTPSARIYAVSAENRAYAVSAENRAYIVPDGGSS